jgi:hypothetical protein
MNIMLNNHKNNIKQFIVFLEKYLQYLDKKVSNPKKNDISMFLLNNEIDKIKDRILNIIDNYNNKTIEPYLKKELDEYSENIQNIKSILPFISLFIISKNFNVYQEDL